MIDAETIFRKSCKCEAAQNRGVKQTEKSDSHRGFWLLFRIETKNERVNRLVLLCKKEQM